MSQYKNNLPVGAGATAPPVSPTETNSVDPNLTYSSNVVHFSALAGGNGSVVNGDGNTAQVPVPTSYAANGHNATVYADDSHNGGNDEGVVSTSPNQRMRDLTQQHDRRRAASDEGRAPETPSAPENPTTEGAGTYYDYLRDDVPDSLRDIYNDEIIFQDEQNAQVVEGINNIRDAGIKNEEEIRDTAYENADTQKETTYTYADRVLMQTLGFNDEQFKYLLDSINTAKETGLALAEDARKILQNLAVEVREQIYKAAEAARLREYEQADITRQRGIVDASNSYEQNKATYGANAESLASMGLTGGGYSDYLNAQAYAVQRSEVQAVNADAEATKRAARYAEDEKKLNADISYSQNVTEAELQYNERVGDVIATYEADLRDANLWKREADNAAYRENEDTKFAADTTYNAATGAADVTYLTNVADINRQADLAIIEANAETAQAKHDAEVALKEGLITNEQAVAEYKDTMFYYFLEKAGTGAYTAEQLEAIAAELDFDDTQKQMLNDALSEHNTAVEEEEAAEAKEEEENLAAVSAQNYQTIITNIKTDPDSYSEADIDKMVTDKLLTGTDAALAKQLIKDTKTKFAKDDIDYYISSGDFDTLQSYLEEAYDGGNGIIDQDTYQDAYFRASLQNCANASSTSEILQVEADLKNLKDAGKISAADYDAAMEYMYASQGGLLNASSYTVTMDEETGFEITTKKLKITLDGESYSIPISTKVNGGVFEAKTADDKTAKILTGIAGGGTPAENSLVMLDGQLYVYSGVWREVKNTGDLYDKYNTLCGYQAKPTTPSHTPGTLTYQDVAKLNPSIRTQNEFNRGNNPDKQKYGTYQAYLQAMYEKYAK